MGYIYVNQQQTYYTQLIHIVHNDCVVTVSPSLTHS